MRGCLVDIEFGVCLWLLWSCFWTYMGIIIQRKCENQEALKWPGKSNDCWEKNLHPTHNLAKYFPTKFPFWLLRGWKWICHKFPSSNFFQDSGQLFKSDLNIILWQYSYQREAVDLTVRSDTDSMAVCPVNNRTHFIINSIYYFTEFEIFCPLFTVCGVFDT